MATIRRVEEIEAWKKARTLVREIYRVTDSGEFISDFALRNQIRKAAISIMSNIAEGFERNGNREFYQFLSISKGSAGEVRSHLYVAADLGYLDQDVFRSLSRELAEIVGMITGLMKYLQQSSLKGSKYADHGHRNGQETCRRNTRRSQNPQRG